MARFYKRTQPLLCTPYFFSRLGYSSLTFHTRTPLPKRRATLCTSLCTYPQMNVFVRSVSHGGASTLKNTNRSPCSIAGSRFGPQTPKPRYIYERLKMAINDGEGTRSRRSPTFPVLCMYVVVCGMVPPQSLSNKDTQNSCGVTSSNVATRFLKESRDRDFLRSGETV